MDQEKLNFKSIAKRLKSETPKFWKQIRNIMIGCGTVGAALMALPAEQTVWLCTWAPDHIAGTLVTIGAVGTALSSLTKVP